MTGRIYRAGATGTAPVTGKGRIYRAGLTGTASVLVSVIADYDNVEPETNLAITATLQGGGSADSWTWRRVSGAAIGINGTGASVSFLAPSDINGTSVVVGVTATVGPTTSPEETFTVTVLPQTEWWWTGSAWTPRTEVWTAPGASAAVPLVGNSAMAWNSLAFGYTPTSVSTFETWRGRSVDGVLYFPARATWAQMKTLPTRRSNDLVVFSIPPYPEGVGNTNTALAAGTYDANIQDWAAALVAAGWNTDRTAIRLGWENNLSSYEWSWSSTTYTTWIAAYRRFVIQARTAGLTSVKWDWCLNKGPSGTNSSVSWTVGYPGDDVVDVIGMDPYDWYAPTTTDAQWTANTTGKNPGLQDVATYARSRGKQISIDEWGVVVNTDPVNAGQDNAFYIAKMFAFCQANADILAWESYYDGASYSKLSNNSKPLAGAEYRKAYPLGWGAS